MFPFPVLFSVDFNLTKAEEVVTFLSDGRYIDEPTRQLELILITYNPVAGLWAYSSLS